MKTSPFDKLTLDAIQDTLVARPSKPFNYFFFFRLFGIPPLLILAFGYLAPIIFYILSTKEELEGFIDEAFDTFFGENNRNFHAEWKEVILSHHDFFNEYWDTIGIDLFSLYFNALEGSESILETISIEALNEATQSLGELENITTFVPEIAIAMEEDLKPLPEVVPPEEIVPPPPEDIPSNCPPIPADAHFEGIFDWATPRIFQTEKKMFYYEFSPTENYQHEGEITIKNNTGLTVRVWISRCPYGSPLNSSFQDSGDGFASISWTQHGSETTHPLINQEEKARVFLGRGSDVRLFLCFENPTGRLATIDHATNGLF